MVARSEYDVVIVGSGLVGSTLALWLAKHTEHRVAVVEQSSPLKPNVNSNQRVVALGKIATDLLHDIGIFADLGLAHCYPYERMFVWDESSNGELEFHAKDSDCDQLGFMVDAQQCSVLLHNALQQSAQVECFFNSSVTGLGFDCDLAEVRIDDAHALSTQLLVGADGARSWVRQQAKIFANHHSYSQQGIVAKVVTGAPHQDCAWQHFLSTGPVAILPLSNNESSIVWSADTEVSNELMAMSAADFCRALEAALDGRLGDVSLLSSRRCFPLHSLRAERYYKRNLVLVGDAAHAIHPLAGQGANLGFKDVLALGKLLHAAPPEEIGSPRLLQRFEALRKPDNQQTDLLMSALYSIYRDTQPFSMVMRGLGMNWINRSSALRGLVANQAIGG